MRRAAIPALAGVLAACAIVPDSGERADSANVPVVQPLPLPSPEPAAPPPVLASEPGTFLYSGEATQGGWIRGQAPGGTLSATLDGEVLELDGEGRFFVAFDRDAGDSATLRAILPGGRAVESIIAISPRAWDIERVNVARAPGGASAAFMERRRPELERIAAARAVRSDSEGWRQDFIWPATGRISGRFGSQRIYRGEPGAYHSGLDIATGGSGAPFVAPADGVVVLATETPFSLEGNLLIIDHGMGLNSAFLHCSSIAVREGDRVRQGQHIGNIGATGRATGPHLHWGIVWRGARLDPLLFTGPMG